MNTAHLLSASLLAALAGGCRSEGDAAAAPSGKSMIQSPVLIELFTSQGCSSCPPAEALLPKLPAAVAGVTVLPLAYHVDYWDDLGWRDPFSSPEWTERQRRYASAVSEGRVYTPQLVIQGAAHVVGSDRSDAIDAIRSAAARPPEGRIEARVIDADGGVLEVEVEAQLPANSAWEKADAWVATTEGGLSTRIARGENQGRALQSELVVRRLDRAFSVARGAARRATLSLAAAPGWRREHLAVTVFLQDPRSLRVLAAASAERR